jgi:hypothetical protein
MATAIRHRFGAVLVALIAVFTLTVPVIASPSDEAAFVELMNASRAASGLNTLATYADLVDDARRHTDDMIVQGQIFHSTEAELTSVTTGWAAIGENVGMGPNPDILHQAFMASPSHKANILGDYDRVGVGVDRSGDGTMFVTVLFMKDAAVPVTTTTTTTAPPPPPPPTPTPVTVPAVAPAAAESSLSLIEVVAPAAPEQLSSSVDVLWIEHLVLGRTVCVNVVICAD